MKDILIYEGIEISGATLLRNNDELMRAFWKGCVAVTENTSLPFCLIFKTADVFAIDVKRAADFVHGTQEDPNTRA